MKKIYRYVSIFFMMLCCINVAIAQDSKKMRIIALDPASIEILYLLGAEDNIVAIANLQHSNIEPVEKTSKLASVGSFSNPSIEKIVLLKPDLVILSSYSLGLKEKLEALGIKSLYIEAKRIEDIKTNITTLATLVHKESQGKQLNAQMEQDFIALQESPLQGKAIFLYATNPLMAFTDNSSIADVLRLIGLENATPQSDIKRPIISAEHIVKANPDYLILGMEAKYDDILKLYPTFKKTKAYQNGHILAYDKVHSLLRLSPTIVRKIKDFKTQLEQSNNKKGRT
ncbi:ABC transporter substrate-binding protein [Helicobacter trogontum]|uniref:ABC transporter substrate-binding protein n=1 Tax=Helicobacter trogontum TaxID=50960 RepID=A0A4U8SAH3_9HELI|nr:helical backbone metal receptor [Helicobacter trogontum]TLD83034.1 ABC transporter substrate-binding protein [Helicobacter trogontum]